MQPNQFSQPSVRKSNKTVLYIVLAVASVPLLIILVVVAMIVDFSVFSKQRDEASIKAASQDISLSGSVKLLNSTYIDLKCLDVCANLTNEYSFIGNFANASEDIGESLTTKGYVFENESYTKQVKNKDVDIAVVQQDLSGSPRHLKLKSR